jgi:hypothetical protein
MRFDPITAVMVLVLLLAVAGFAAWKTHALDRFTTPAQQQQVPEGADGPGVRVPIS